MLNFKISGRGGEELWKILGALPVCRWAIRHTAAIEMHVAHTVP